MEAAAEDEDVDAGISEEDGVEVDLSAPDTKNLVTIAHRNCSLIHWHSAHCRPLPLLKLMYTPRNMISTRKIVFYFISEKGSFRRLKPDMLP